MYVSAQIYFIQISVKSHVVGITEGHSAHGIKNVTIDNKFVVDYSGKGFSLVMCLSMTIIIFGEQTGCIVMKFTIGRQQVEVYLSKVHTVQTPCHQTWDRPRNATAPSRLSQAPTFLTSIADVSGLNLG
jgi:hypothetical protein